MLKAVPSTRTVLAAWAAGVLCFHAFIPAAENWPRWRGPRGDGHTAESGLPTRWDAASVAWKTPLKGRGQSSPTIWGDRMFLTTALENGKQRLVFCVDPRDGRALWEHVAWTGEPEKSHVMNGWASATCATNGEVVVAFFGKGGLHAYAVDQSEAGETVVIEPGPALRIVARNSLGAGEGELFRASLTPFGGRIYSRSTAYLYCIGEHRPQGDSPK